MALSSVRKPHHQDYDAQTPQLIPHAPVTFVNITRHENFNLRMQAYCVFDVIGHEFLAVNKNKWS